MAEERAHHVLRPDQQGHHQHQEYQGAEKPIRVAAEYQDTARDYNPDDGQGKRNWAGDGGS